MGLSKEFFISGQTPSTKNGRIWTGTYFIVSKATSKWRRETKQEWKTQKQDFLNEIRGLKRPYFIHMTFIRNRDNAWDFLNIGQGVLDEMVHHQWINDDNIHEIIPVFGKPSINRIKPGVIIRVLKRKPIYEL